MVGRISASGYAAVTSQAVWTSGWLATACLATVRVTMSIDASAVALLVSLSFVCIGCRTALRLARRVESSEPDPPWPPDPWPRRIFGWIAAVVWCGVAFVWNLITFQGLLHLARDGRGGAMLVLVPFSLISRWLLLLLFVAVGVLIDSLARVVRGKPV